MIRNETLTYGFIERVMVEYKESRGLRWLDEFYKTVGIENIIASGLGDSVVDLLDELGENRTKVWRAKKMFANRKVQND